VILAVSWLMAATAGPLWAQSTEEGEKGSGEGDGQGELLTSGVTAVGLAVDPVTGGMSGNGVLEPDELAVVAPIWSNGGPEAVFLTGAASGLQGPPGASYTVPDGSASYGVIGPGLKASCLDTGDAYEMSVTLNGAPRPVFHWDAVFTEAVSGSGVNTSKDWTLHVGESFTDVPMDDANYLFIETLLHEGVTGGCGSGLYCPRNYATREQMAVFAIAAKYPGWTPPPCQPGAEMFMDVPASSPFCPWIEELARHDVVLPCELPPPYFFCPGSGIYRNEAAYVLVTVDEPNALPPPCDPANQLYVDVPAPNYYCRWIEALGRKLRTFSPPPIPEPTCSTDGYCPSDFCERGSAARLVVGGYGLRLYKE
jgi:hypothetical protein